MSNVLIIRHLPTGLSFHDKEQLLKHFGAEKVWETRAKRNYIFASFPSIEQAKISLTRLHQLEIDHRRLVVEYSFEKEPTSSSKDLDNATASATTKHIKDFLKTLNAWNPSVDFYQAPPVHLRYKYPEPSPQALINIIHTFTKHKPFYTQTLHLMNKMSLEMPFQENKAAYQYFKETFREFFMDEIAIPLPESEPESEISSDENVKEKQNVTTLVKRKHTLPKTRKRPGAVLSTAALPKAKKKTTINQEEVFEAKHIQEPKKISVVVSQDALSKQPEVETEVVGEMGKFQKEEEPVKQQETPPEPELATVTKKELLRNRISYSDMKVLPIFKNYHPGEPSMRLYIKNFAKTVTEQDVKRIYRRYIEDLSEEEQIGFDVRVMQEGRMKGQGFVTFPSVKIAEKALHETNGYLLKEKPIVVQFARVASKKTAD